MPAATKRPGPAKEADAPAPAKPRFLPTAKTKGVRDPLRRKFILFGRAKIGKSTFGSKLAPNETIFFATDPGLDAIEAYKVPINSWQDFLDGIDALANEKHPFKMVVIDTGGILQGLCATYVIEGMRSSEGFRPDVYVHASDFEYGKGWSAISDEFKLRVAKLCSLGLGVMFVCHEKETTIKTRTGAEVHKYAPDVGQGASSAWLQGFVDFVIRISMEGDERVLQLNASDDVVAGGRIEEGFSLPDKVPADPEKFVAGMKRAMS